MLYKQFAKGKEEVSILGYGCMRFPTKSGRIDLERTEKQIMLAIGKGVNYFDTAYVYPGSEAALGTILKKNGVREKVRIATKIPHYIATNRASMERVLKTQLERLKTDYLDCYLIHALQDRKDWERVKANGLIDFMEEMKKKGTIRRIGFSYHGSKDDFKAIIDDYGWDFCQIQYNYIDEYNQAGKDGLRHAHAKGISVVVMEPLRGGSLVGKMPEPIKKIWNKSGIKRSYADWALRWLWDQPEVTVVLSGLNEESHIEENVRIADDVRENSLNEEELSLYREVKDTYLKLMRVGCTGCGYCMPCPAGVNIPFCFSYYNTRYLFNERKAQFNYLIFASDATGGGNSLASLCKECGKCEKVCPQHLEIRKHLKEVKAYMEPWWSKPLIGVLRLGIRVMKTFTGRKKPAAGAAE